MVYVIPDWQVPKCFNLQCNVLPKPSQIWCKCSFHRYANDTDLSISVQPDFFASAQSSVRSCIADILLWMNSSKLKLNPEKTEVMIADSKHNLCKVLSDSMFCYLSPRLLYFQVSVPINWLAISVSRTVQLVLFSRSASESTFHLTSDNFTGYLLPSDWNINYSRTRL